jgi:transposase
VSTDITVLDTKLQRFVHLYLTGAYTNKELAGLMDVHINTVYSWINREDVQMVISDMQKKEHEAVEIRLKSLRAKALEKMNDLMDSPIDGVAFQACKDVLDRTGHKAKNEVKVEKTVKTIEMQLKDLADNILTDVDFVEVD